MTMAPSLGTDVPPSALRTASIRFPLIDTSPGNGAAPLPSKMRTLVNRIMSEPHVETEPDLTQALRRQPSRHTVDIPIGRRWVRTRRREGWSSKQGDRFVLIAEVAGENGDAPGLIGRPDSETHAGSPMRRIHEPRIGGRSEAHRRLEHGIGARDALDRA